MPWMLVSIRIGINCVRRSDLTIWQNSIPLISGSTRSTTTKSTFSMSSTENATEGRLASRIR